MRIFRTILPILATVLALGAAEARFEWRDVEQRVEIGADGSVVVDDTRTLWTDEDFGEAFICVGHGSAVSVTLLGGSGAVSPGPDADAYTQACEDGSAGTELVVEQDARVGERRVRFHYRLDGTVEPFGDVVQWYWNLVQLDHPPIRGYDLEVRAPGAMEAPYDAFVHRYDNPEEPRVSLDGARRTLTVAFDRIPSGDGVEIRWLMPPDLFEVSGSGERLEEFLGEEAELARIDVPGSPKLELSAPRDVSGGGAVVSGSARDPDGIDRVIAQVGQGERVACEGGETFRCELDGLVTGANAVTVLAYDGAGDIASARATIRRLTWGQRIRRHPLWILLPLAALAWVARGVARAYLKHGREPQVQSMMYPFEPPSDDLPPAVVASLMHQRKPQGSRMGPALFATIMDLARRGYGRFTGDGRSFQMSLDLDRDDADLLPFERDVLDFLKDAARRKGDGEVARLDLSELKAHSKRHGKRFLSRWSSGVRDWLTEQRGGQLLQEGSAEAANRWSLWSLLAAMASVGLGFLLEGPGQVAGFVGAGLCVLLVVLAGTGIPAWRPEIAREVKGWQGFKRTLTDYTRMKDAPPDFFGLWDHYYCYAAALGVAERYLRTLRRAAPMAGVDDRAMMRRATWMGASVTSASDFGSFSSAVSSLSSALSTASASASSGGSSSGGGGGGGGGGSSGGR